MLTVPVQPNIVDHLCGVVVEHTGAQQVEEHCAQQRDAMPVAEKGADDLGDQEEAISRDEGYIEAGHVG